MIDGIFDSTMTSLERGLSHATKAQEVIAQNIANAQTPGYVAKKFDDVLEHAVERRNGAGVNLEEEMSDMALNNNRHAAYLKLMASKLAILRTVISQGRK
ncbi:MAG: flagellar basal body protein [Candidatus Margulisiibacteriota bacterium]